MNDAPSLPPADGSEATPAAPLHELRDGVLSLLQSCGGLTAGSIGIWQLLLDLQHRHGIRGHAFEIGILTGGAAAMMAAHLRPDERYIGIDIALQRETIERNIAMVAGLGPQSLHLYEGCSRHLQRIGALDEWRGQCRFFHVDGEHSYDAVRSDLEFCEQLMSNDAIIVVDDIMNPESVCVPHALFDYLRDRPHRLRMFLCGVNKAYLCAPARLDFYRTACLDNLVPFVETTTGERLRLAKNSHAWEIDYLSVAPRGDGAPYMRIGQYLQNPPAR